MRSVHAVGVGGADCTLGINCAANTSMCVHGNGCFHQMWSRDFPATDAVVEFFAREACQLRGVWREAREGAPPRCRCRGAAAAKAQAARPRASVPRHDCIVKS